jgi:hypothetical protein
MILGGNDTLSLPILIAYGILILLYLVILKVLLNLLQQLGSKHRTQRSVIDVDIHNTMTPHVDSSMQTFDVRSIANIIARGIVTVTAMAILIVLSVIKIGFLATVVLISIVILCMWAINQLLRQMSRTEIMKTVHKYTQLGGGNTGAIVLLSIGLVVVLFGLVFLH